MNNNPKLELFNQACHQYKGIVISSENLQATLLKKFGITPAEFFRPFLPRRTMRLKLGQKEKEKEFNIKLLDHKEYDQIGMAKLDKFSRQTIDENAGDINSVQPVTKQTSKQLIDNIYEQNKMVSFQPLQQIVGDALGYQYNLNFLDQPILIIYALSGQEQNVVKEIEQLKLQTDKLIRIMYQNNTSDLESVKKIILVLNDAQEVVQYESVDQINKEFQNHTCKILKFNLPQSIETTNWARLAYTRYFFEGEVPKKPLAILDDPWTKQYRIIFEDLINNLVIPYVERFVNILTQQYLELSKKQFDLFNFLKRSDSQRYENDYQMTQKESMLRYLADHHFLMNDYDTAATYYKQLTSELKNNKTNTTIATLFAQEYHLYSRLLGQQKVDNLWNTFDELCNGYSKIEFPYLLRLMFFYVNTIYSHQRFTKDQIMFLQKCHKYLKDLGAKKKPDYFSVYYILIYEQISFIYLKLEFPQIRKFAHNLTLVANKYDSENFKKHSLRCFKTVEQIYLQSQWPAILYWLYGHIGANYIENRKVPESIDAFKQAFNLLNDRQLIDQHNQLVIDWKKTYSSLEVVNDFRSKFFPLSKLQLKIPIIKGPIDILTHGIDHLHSIQNFQVKQTNRGSWNSLLGKEQLSFYEEALIKSYDATYLEERINCFTKWPCVLDMSKLNFQDRFDKFARQIFVNDVIVLKIYINLPLKVASNISEMQVQYEFFTVAATQNLLDLEDVTESKAPPTLQRAELPPNCVPIVNLSFQRSVQEYIEVTIQVNRPGYLYIKGVQWCYLGIPTFTTIDYNPKDQTKRKSVNFYNKFKVFPQFFPLEISYKTKPTIVYGEVRAILFSFKNKNSYDIKVTINPIVPFHFGFMETSLIVPAGSLMEHTFYLRCTFQDDFTGQLLLRYAQPVGGLRVEKIEIPMKAEPSFKICLQTDMTVDYWKFTLQVQDYFGGKGKLTFNRILCLNQNWELVGEPYESQGQNFNLATFKLKKIGQPVYEYEDYQARIKDQFYKIGDKFNQIILNDENAISHETAIDFINLDIRHYFSIFYSKSQNFQKEEFPLFLICRWKYVNQENEVTYGLHELPVLPQNYFHKNVNELPISIKYQAPQSLAFDVATGRICVAPVIITFKNTKYVEPIEFAVQLFNGDEPVKHLNDIQQPGFLWEGEMQYDISLNPQESRQIKLDAVFYETGLYDLSRMRISMKKTFKEYYSMDYEQVIIRIQ